MTSGLANKERALLELLIEKAPALRAAGVVMVQMSGMNFSLAASEPVIEVQTNEPDDELDDFDPLHDPTTYGRRDGSVPGYRRPEKTDDDE